MQASQAMVAAGVYMGSTQIVLSRRMTWLIKMIPLAVDGWLPEAPTSPKSFIPHDQSLGLAKGCENSNLKKKNFNL